MSPTLRIALRFLIARKRSMIMSLAGIVFGVRFFVVTQAQTSGFEDFFIRTILGTNGAVRIADKYQDTIRSIAADDDSNFIVSDPNSRRYIAGVDEPKLIREALKQFGNVSGVSEVVNGRVTISVGGFDDSAQAYGINYDDHMSVSDLENQVALGNLEEFRGDPIGVLLGRTLAQRNKVGVGDVITIQSEGESRRYHVSGLFETGVKDIDESRIFMHMSEARSLLKKPFGASFLQINLFDRDRAAADAERMSDVLRHSCVPWQERERIWLGVFRALKFSSAITVSTIILISGLGMFNTLAMIVMEKTREISILRSMGYTRTDISRVFIWQGGIVLAIGTVLGWILGALVTFGVSKGPMPVRGIFTTDTFLVSWSVWHYLEAALVAFAIVMTASLIPARRAARLEPGDVIRGTAS
jgi:lipoprotein-releasing system permease protein